MKEPGGFCCPVQAQETAKHHSQSPVLLASFFSLAGHTASLAKVGGFRRASKPASSTSLSPTELTLVAELATDSLSLLHSPPGPSQAQGPRWLQWRIEAAQLGPPLLNLELLATAQVATTTH